MRRKQRDRLREQPPLTFTIERLTHEGRGVSHYQEQNLAEGLIVHQGQASPIGKTVFVALALPGETVQAAVKETSRKLDEADTVAVIKPSPERVEPPCPHFGMCGGCSLQHWSPDGQITFKQQVLAELFTHAGVAVGTWLPPIRSERLDYRRRARLGVRYVQKRGETLVGFRERRSNFLADLQVCKVLDERIGTQILALRALINELSVREHIAQLEVAAGDAEYLNNVAVIVRHLQPMSPEDEAKLIAFCRAQDWQLYLQAGGYDTVTRVDADPALNRLYYALPAFNLKLGFSPLDFTQVNAAVNRQMIELACHLLQLFPEQRVLDLFCGLGNFSLPLATQVGPTGRVIAVEGSTEMVERGKENAQANGLDQLEFYAFDLTKPLAGQDWAQRQFDAVLIDPPRSGALEMMPFVAGCGAQRIVYVSCNPATLARDAAILTQSGYRLTQAGVMDMFTHTGHVESIACFERL